MRFVFSLFKFVQLDPQLLIANRQQDFFLWMVQICAFVINEPYSFLPSFHVIFIKTRHDSGAFDDLFLLDKKICCLINVADIVKHDGLLFGRPLGNEPKEPRRQQAADDEEYKFSAVKLEREGAIDGGLRCVGIVQNLELELRAAMFKQSHVYNPFPGLRNKNNQSLSIMTDQPRRANSEKRLKHLEKIGFKSEVEKLRKDYSNSKRFNEMKHSEKSKSLKSLRPVAKNNGNFLDPTKIIAVSAPKWAIFDYFSGKYIRGYRAHDSHELSAFSKLLVFCTINTLVTKHKLDMARFQTIVTSTVLKYYKSSLVKEDDIITLEHLLYLMLMHQGQEFELIAALNIGAYLDKKRKKEYYSVYDADDRLHKTHLAEFYGFVNSYCQTMKLESIKYIEHDPQIRKDKNKCSAFDIAALSLECLKIPLFANILKKESTEIQIKFINESGVLDSRRQLLKNKTIQNPFIAYFNVCRNWSEKQFMSSHCSVFYDQEGVKPIVVVALACYSPNDREKDIQQIIEWYIKYSTDKGKKKQDLKQEKQAIKNQEDPQDIYQPPKRHKFKTELTDELDTILQQKLKGNHSKFDYRIKPVKKSRTGRNIFTEMAV